MMSLFDTVSEGASEFLDAIWVDVLVLVISVVVCVLGAVVFPKSDVQAQKVGLSDGPVVRFHKAARMALGACGILQKPRRRSNWERQAVQSRAMPQVTPGSYESFMIALRDALNQDGADSSFGLLKEMQSLDYQIPASAVTRMLRDHSPREACAFLQPGSFPGDESTWLGLPIMAINIPHLHMELFLQPFQLTAHARPSVSAFFRGKKKASPHVRTGALAASPAPPALCSKWFAQGSLRSSTSYDP